MVLPEIFVDNNDDDDLEGVIRNDDWRISWIIAIGSIANFLGQHDKLMKIRKKYKNLQCFPKNAKSLPFC